jgi:hypothetical protein
MVKDEARRYEIGRMRLDYPVSKVLGFPLREYEVSRFTVTYHPHLRNDSSPDLSSVNDFFLLSL